MIEQKVQHVLQTMLTFQIMREIQSKNQPPPKKKRLTNNFRLQTPPLLVHHGAQVHHLHVRLLTPLVLSLLAPPLAQEHLQTPHSQHHFTLTLPPHLCHLCHPFLVPCLLQHSVENVQKPESQSAPCRGNLTASKSSMLKFRGN